MCSIQRNLFLTMPTTRVALPLKRSAIGIGRPVAITCILFMPTTIRLLRVFFGRLLVITSRAWIMDTKMLSFRHRRPLAKRGTLV